MRQCSRPCPPPPIWPHPPYIRRALEGWSRDDARMDDHEFQAAALITVTRKGITLDTLAALLQADHSLSAWCPSCRRWADLDLARLVREGHGKRRLPGFKPRCRACGGPGEIQVRPPMPSWPGGVMYVGAQTAAGDQAPN